MEKYDVLDERNDVLYCSFDCAHAYSTSDRFRKVFQSEFDQQHDDNVLTGAHWGALCDCEREYNNF
jgi:hypothetical protein